ncbi:MAG: cation:proton antiporter [Elusimicrobia bacterium]|nr:cation:proton antiporter [Elusimicrobiota bacterium]
MSVGAFLFTIGLIIYIGVVGSFLFERYRIPDVLNLIIIGFILGPLLHLVKPSLLALLMPYVGAVALGLILFEGGLDLDFDNVLSQFGLSFLLAAGTFLLNMAAIVFFYRWLTGSGWIQCLLLGSVLGCVSSAIILPVSSKLNVPDSVRAAVNMEAVLSDLWGVMTTLVLLRLAELRIFDPGYMVNAVVGAFSTAIVGAGIFGMAWLWALDRLRKSPFAYMMTLAAVMVLYGLTELVHGSGPMAALTFGIVLTNADKIMAVFGQKFKFVLDEKIRWFNTEATFFARTFFFVYLGLVISLKTLTAAFFQVALVIFLIIVICRYLVVRAAKLIMIENNRYADVYVAMLPRGLTSAVLASMVAAARIPDTEIFLEYVFAVILCTNFLMTWMIYKIEKPHSKQAISNVGSPPV